MAVFHLSFAGEEKLNEASITAVALIQKRPSVDEGEETMLTEFTTNCINKWAVVYIGTIFPLLPLLRPISILLLENQKSYPPWESHLIMAIFTPLLVSYYQCYIKWFPLIFATTLILNKKNPHFIFSSFCLRRHRFPPSEQTCIEKFLFNEKMKQKKENLLKSRRK